jgi:hypothetical protein
MKVLEKGAPAAAILAALSALACCLPFGIVGTLGLASVSVGLACSKIAFVPLRTFPPLLARATVFCAV